MNNRYASWVAGARARFIEVESGKFAHGFCPYSGENVSECMLAFRTDFCRISQSLQNGKTYNVAFCTIKFNIYRHIDTKLAKKQKNQEEKC